MQNLQTGDLKVAKKSRDLIALETATQFAKAAQELARGPDEVRDGAEFYKEAYRKFINAPGDFDRQFEEGTGISFIDAVELERDRVRAKLGVEAAQRFDELVTAGAAINEHLEQHLAEADIIPRSKIEKRTVVRELMAWNPKMSLADVDRRTAGRYVSEILASGTLATKTANKKISNLRAYWKWLIRRGIVDDAAGNPWIDQRLETSRRASAEGGMREYSGEEMTTLLYSPYPARMNLAHRERLMDAIKIAALSGMRIEEIFQLRVKDCAGDTFSIVTAKTRAGVRKVPIHRDLTTLVERRTAGKKDTAFLFDDVRTRTGERSQPVSKQFGRYRKLLGVDETPAGKRRSRVDFHSLRRWFITKAERAGQAPHIIEAVVGHKRQGMSLGRYSGGPSVDQQMRECVEAVRLPAGVELVP